MLIVLLISSIDTVSDIQRLGGRGKRGGEKRGGEREGVAELEHLMFEVVPEFVEPLRPNVRKVAHPQS